MVTLKEFIKYELNDYVKGIILTTIHEGRAMNRQEDELIFNRYSLSFFYGRNEVIIYDDVLFEDAPLKLDIDSFLDSITAAN